MSLLFNKFLALSLASLTLLQLCFCAPQSYYTSSLSSYLSDRASKSRHENPYPHESYSSHGEYFDALKQRRMRALANSYRGIYSIGSSDTQQDYPTTTQKPRTNKADEQNAKFVGIRNQEANDENTSKTFGHLKRKRRRQCFGFGRNVNGNYVTPPPNEQGRLLWDLNIYNIYSGGGYPLPVRGCGNFGGGGGLAGAFAGAGGLGGLGGAGGLDGGGLFSDPLNAAYAPPNSLNNFLQLFAPGILQNALAATISPMAFRPQADPVTGEVNDTDPNVNPNYNPLAARPPPPIRRPNRVYYDSAGAPSITPAQLVGGVATTVNGIIQQLTGNVQPVYPGYRALTFGK